MPGSGTGSESVPETIVRAYRRGDRDAVRDICCRTAFRNRGARAMLLCAGLLVAVEPRRDEAPAAPATVATA